jgi:hypothetical protein
MGVLLDVKPPNSPIGCQEGPFLTHPEHNVRDRRISAKNIKGILGNLGLSR